MPLKDIQLPESEGYKFCTNCKKYTFEENIHCEKCKLCPSKVRKLILLANICSFDILKMTYFNRMEDSTSIVINVKDVLKLHTSIVARVNSVI